MVADALRIHGVDRVFCVPGESYLAALDALYERRDAVRLIVCRQEGGAANMAEAYGKLTNRPGVCFVTRGPGATNASTGVHTAFQDSTPMVLFIGQVARRMRGRGEDAGGEDGRCEEKANGGSEHERGSRRNDSDLVRTGPACIRPG